MPLKLPALGATGVLSVHLIIRKCAVLVVLAAAFFPATLRAGDAAAITFAVPDAGLVTLGVFDKAGRLVRTLHRLAPEKDFRVEDNGYATKWDGKDDAGRRLPAGHYHIRGFLVGNVKVEGEDFHFNDWEADKSAPKFSRIMDFSLLENDDVVLLFRDESKPLVGRYSSEHGFLWTKELSATIEAPAPETGAPANPAGFEPLLATNSSAAVVLTSGGWHVFSLENGEAGPAKTFDGTPPKALAATPGAIFSASAAGLTTFPLPGLAAGAVQPAPPVFKALDADSTRVIGAGDDGIRLQKNGAAFEKIPLAADVASVSLGAGDTFWIVGSESGSTDRIVAQSSPSGEILRTLRPEPGGPRPDIIRASRTAEKFATLESRPGLQRLRVMERGADGGWTILWQRTREDCPRFGFVNDRVAADAGVENQAGELSFRLEENPLTGKREILSLRAVFDKTGTRLVTTDGLPVVDVSPRADISRIAICRGKPADTMRLLQGNGSVVEEF